jgi:hypothetical protein
LTASGYFIRAVIPQVPIAHNFLFVVRLIHQANRLALIGLFSDKFFLRYKVPQALFFL